MPSRKCGRFFVAASVEVGKALRFLARLPSNAEARFAWVDGSLVSARYHVDGALRRQLRIGSCGRHARAAAHAWLFRLTRNEALIY